ncbi:DUF429 domain-containing protein [Candidatus Micrarchaeota archaeon]|nr:DUF429 domain-containing protein [Candidatus Micrarchaeota archaeon]
MSILSIDLASNPKNPTGVAVLERNRIITSTHFSDSQLLDIINNLRPSLVGIDAPLSLPNGRISIDERDSNHFRECDLKLRQLKIRFFPITLGAMRTLTKRGMALKQEILRILPTSSVVEIFPGASFDILGLERKNIKSCTSFLASFKAAPVNVHESDAAIGAFTLLHHQRSNSLELTGSDGTIILPNPSSSRSSYYKRL